MTYRIQSAGSTTIVRCYGASNPAPWEPVDVEASFAFDAQFRTAHLRALRGVPDDRQWAELCMVAMLLGATTIAADDMLIGSVMPGGVLSSDGKTRVDISDLAERLTHGGDL